MLLTGQSSVYSSQETQYALFIRFSYHNIDKELNSPCNCLFVWMLHYIRYSVYQHWLFISEGQWLGKNTDNTNGSFNFLVVEAGIYLFYGSYTDVFLDSQVYTDSGHFEKYRCISFFNSENNSQSSTNWYQAATTPIFIYKRQ